MVAKATISCLGSMTDYLAVKGTILFAGDRDNRLTGAMERSVLACGG